MRMPKNCFKVLNNNLPLKNIHLFIYINNQLFYLQRWGYLLNQNLIKFNITFHDGTVEGIEEKMVSEFPIIKEYGWNILRPFDSNSTGLIPFMVDKPKNGITLRK